MAGGNKESQPQRVISPDLAANFCRHDWWTAAQPSSQTKMRLTADLIQNSLSYINPLLERELDLRGVFPKSRCYTF